MAGNRGISVEIADQTPENFRSQKDFANIVELLTNSRRLHFLRDAFFVRLTLKTESIHLVMWRI